MSRRNYNAFIKAARKTGGLSLPAARKAYKKITDRLGRPARGKDVSAHPRIFKQTITGAGGRRKPGFADTRLSTVRQPARKVAAESRGAKRGSAGSVKKLGRIQAAKKSTARRGAMPRETLTPRPSRVVVRDREDLTRWLDDRGRQGLGLPNASEFVSTPEYTKRGPKGRFHLQLQVHITAPTGPEYTKRFLDRVANDWLQGKGVPGGIEVRALGWNDKKPTTNKLQMRVARSNFRKIPFTF